MKCESVTECLDALLDGEVDASARIEIERHLSGCEICRERQRFAEGFRARLRAVAPREHAPEQLKERMMQALLAERELGRARNELSWPYTLALAAVASILFGVGLSVDRGAPAAYAGVAPVLGDVVRAHTSSFSAEVAQPDAVPAYFSQRVGFAVAPVDFADREVHFLGARAVEVAGRTAATLRYERAGRPLTVVAFRAPKMARALGDGTATSGSLRFVLVQGHLVPLIERDGVIYAVVGDLPMQEHLAVARSASLH